jgi:hypothetical protein
VTKSALFGAAVLALTVTAAGAAEDTISASYMLPNCRAFVDYPKEYTDDHLPIGFCAGLVSGIDFMGSYMALSQQWYPLPKDDFRRQILCTDAPAGSILVQEIRIIIKYIDARPARMHEDFRSLALEAIRDTWPCKP